MSGIPARTGTMRWSRPFRRVWRYLSDQVVQDTPEDDALCEFDCRKEQCTLGEWKTCERRLQRAAGELMPPTAQRQKEGAESRPRR